MWLACEQVASASSDIATAVITLGGFALLGFIVWLIARNP